MSSIELYTTLKEKVGEQQAKTLTEYIGYKVADSFDKEKNHLATKEDLVREIGLVRKEIAESKADTLKWMIVLFASFYVGMIVFLI